LASMASCAFTTNHKTYLVVNKTASACPGADIHSETKMMKGRPEI
jgi:hypothetical protein